MYMKRLTIFLIILLLNNNLFSNEVYWSTKLLSYSSQLDSKQNSAYQILGKPSVDPRWGFTPCAWTPFLETNSDIEFIEVAPSNTISVKSVYINEPLNPGAVSKVILYSNRLDSVVAYQNDNPEYISDVGRIFKISLENPTKFNVNKIRIELKTNRIPGRSLIDAVGVSKDDFNYNVEINANKVFKEQYLFKKNLGLNVNSASSELIPLYSSNSNELYFTRVYHEENLGEEKNSNIWVSKFNGEDFEDTKIVPGKINNNFHNFALSLSQDGNSMLLGNEYNSDGSMKSGLSMTYKAGSDWTFPAKLIIEGYENENATPSYCLGTDGKTLLLSLNNSESIGGNDLFVSFKRKSKWTKPINLGDMINTADDEITPFLAPDNKTIYFSSKGYPGFGLMDIFYSIRLDDTWQKWSEPVNMGSKINSYGWEQNFVVDQKNRKAYFVGTEESYGAEDIFSIDLPKVYKPLSVVRINGKVINDKTNEPLAAEIIYQNLNSGEVIGTAQSNKLTGEFSLSLPLGTNYSIISKAENYISVSENIDTRKIKNAKKMKLDILMVPIEKGQKVRLNNIFFQTGSFDLLPDSFTELDRVVELLQENIDLKIEIQGHTDDVGSPENNLQLSKNRARSVANYILSKGIEPSRISQKGFGESKPIKNSTSPVARKLNRRVEFEIK